MPNLFIPTEYISKLSKQEQINELNSEVKCVLAPSPIHGIGVFALRDIKKEEKLYCIPRIIPRFYNLPFGSLNKLFPEIREIILARWASIKNGSIFQSPNDDAGLLFFCNHSSNPNYDVIHDIAIKDIKKGEEVLEDYRTMINYKDIFPWIKD